MQRCRRWFWEPTGTTPEGRVWAREEPTERFVNRSISAFGACLATYEWYRQTVRDLDEDAALELVEKAAELICAVDPEALANEESYWAVIVEQMRDGLL